MHRNANSTLVWWNAKYVMGAFPHFKLDLHDECDLLVDSLPYSAVNTRRTPLQDAFVHKCDDWLFALLQLAPVYLQVRVRRKKDQIDGK